MAISGSSRSCAGVVAAWREGAQLVTAVRRSRQESHKLLALLFLFFIDCGGYPRLSDPANAGIFGLFDRRCSTLSIVCARAIAIFLASAWVGYRTAIVYYDRQDRVGGEGN